MPPGPGAAGQLSEENVALVGWGESDSIACAGLAALLLLVMEPQPGGLKLMSLGLDKVVGADGANDVADANLDAAVVVPERLGGWNLHEIRPSR